jgi:hypothetical protein
MGRNPALIRAFERQGIAPERAAAMMQGNMQFLSEDNRQRALAGEAASRTSLDERRLGLEERGQQFQQDWLGRQPQAPAIAPEVASQLTTQAQTDYDQMIAGGMPPVIAAQQVQQRYSQIQPGFAFTPYQPRRTPGIPRTAGTSQAVIDRMRSSGDPQQVAAADEAERKNKELQDAERGARRSGWGGMWRSWGGEQ